MRGRGWGEIPGGGTPGGARGWGWEEIPGGAQN